MDEAFRFVSAGWPSRLAMHYMYERHHRGADHAELGFAYHADLLLVSSFPLLYRHPLTDLSVYRYLSLFVIYTPYTIYQCTLHSEYNSGGDVLLTLSHRWVWWLVQGHLQGRVEMWVFVFPNMSLGERRSRTIDIILAACDVEGNFLVVKVRHTFHSHSPGADPRL